MPQVSNITYKNNFYVLRKIYIVSKLAASGAVSTVWILTTIEYGIFREGSQISTNQKRENSAFLLLIG